MTNTIEKGNKEEVTTISQKIDASDIHFTHEEGSIQIWIGKRTEDGELPETNFLIEWTHGIPTISTNHVDALLPAIAILSPLKPQATESDVLGRLFQIGAEHKLWREIAGPDGPSLQEVMCQIASGQTSQEVE